MSGPRTPAEVLSCLNMVLNSFEWDFNVIKFLLERNASFINAHTYRGKTLLQRVIPDHKCNVEIINLFIDHGADVNLASNFGSPLMESLLHCRGRVEIIKVLLDRGASVIVVEGFQSPLSEAIRQGFKTDILKKIIDHGADVNHLNSILQSPLCVALACGREPYVIQLLVDSGSSVKACKSHMSPLHCITLGQPIRTEIFRMLLKKDCGVVVDESNRSELHLALRNSDYETGAMKMLLSLEGLDINTKDSKGSTLLHGALWNPKCKYGVVKLLIVLGVRTDLLDSDGDTPLHKLVQIHQCRPGIVRILLKGNSPVNVLNKGGESSLDIAVKKRQSTYVLRMLLAAGEKVRHPESPALAIVVSTFRSGRNVQNLDNLYTFLKYLLLENPTIDIYELIRDNYDSCGDPNAWIYFWDECLTEIENMDHTNIGDGITLLDLISYDFEEKHRNGYGRLNYFDNKQLFEIVRDGEFPLYSEVIAAKIGFEYLEDEFLTRKVYTSKFNYNTSPRTVSEVILTSQCVEHLGTFLSQNDLINVLQVFQTENRLISKCI